MDAHHARGYNIWDEEEDLLKKTVLGLDGHFNWEVDSSKY